MSENKDQKPFVVRLESYGGLGDPMVVLNGIPAYVKRTKTLRPRVGEEWFVTIEQKNEKRIILNPIRKFIPAEETERKGV